MDSSMNPPAMEEALILTETVDEMRSQVQSADQLIAYTVTAARELFGSLITSYGQDFANFAWQKFRVLRDEVQRFGKTPNFVDTDKTVKKRYRAWRYGELTSAAYCRTYGVTLNDKTEPDFSILVLRFLKEAEKDYVKSR